MFSALRLVQLSLHSAIANPDGAYLLHDSRNLSAQRDIKLGDCWAL